MILGSCHCRSVRFELTQSPERIKECHCSVCRRYGALWAHVRPNEVNFIKEPGATFTYLCNDHVIAFHICRTCGNLTHWEELYHPPELIAINMRLACPKAIADIARI